MTKQEYSFLNIEYLRVGTEQQREVYKVLQELNILEQLKPFNPLLVGTFPIDINVDGSDLDIACEVHDHELFRDLLMHTYGEFDGYDLRARIVDGLERTVCNFSYKSWLIELFGQPLPTTQQNAYRHMIIESRILNILGDRARDAVRKLKASGLKTEPAFGQLLKISGDPYKVLLAMEQWEEEELVTHLQKNLNCGEYEWLAGVSPENDREDKEV